MASGRLATGFLMGCGRRIGLGGPFTIQLERLVHQLPDGRITAERAGDDREIQRTTQPYSLAALGSSLYFTGENSATLTRGMGTNPDRLEVRVGIHSEGWASGSWC